MVNHLQHLAYEQLDEIFIFIRVTLLTVMYVFNDRRAHISWLQRSYEESASFSSQTHYLHKQHPWFLKNPLRSEWCKQGLQTPIVKALSLLPLHMGIPPASSPVPYWCLPHCQTQRWARGCPRKAHVPLVLYACLYALQGVKTARTGW